MKTLEFTCANDLAQLHDELLAAIPSLDGTWVDDVEILDADGAVRATAQVEEPKLRVEGLGDAITLMVPEETNEKAIAAIVKAHVPKRRAHKPAAADSVFAALSQLDPRTATVADLIAAATGALEQAGAKQETEI